MLVFFLKRHGLITLAISTLSFWGADSWNRKILIGRVRCPIVYSWNDIDVTKGCGRVSIILYGYSISSPCFISSMSIFSRTKWSNIRKKLMYWWKHQDVVIQNSAWRNQKAIDIYAIAHFKLKNLNFAYWENLDDILQPCKMPLPSLYLWIPEPSPSPS